MPNLPGGCLIEVDTNSNAATPAWRPRKSSGDRTPANAGSQHLSSMDDTSDATTEALIAKAAAGLSAGAQPMLESAGTGGAYRLSTVWGSPLAILKPRNEEAFAPDNPRGLRSPAGKDEGFRSGAVAPGTGADREAAAFKLDHGNLAGVPITALVKVQHPSLATGEPQEASLQEYISHQGPAGDFSPSLFTVQSVHGVAQLDLRLVNLDRNDANLLVKPKSGEGLELAPIDHGLCLPDQVAMSSEGVAWMSWAQAKQPWDPKVKAYILSLDADADAAVLQKFPSVSEDARLLSWAATRLLQLSAAAGWTPFDAAQCVYRPDFDAVSALEQCVLFAKRAVDVGRHGIDPEGTPFHNFLPREGPGDDLGPALDSSQQTDDTSSASTTTSHTASPAVLHVFENLLDAGDTTPRGARDKKHYVENALKKLVRAGPSAAGDLYLI